MTSLSIPRSIAPLEQGAISAYLEEEAMSDDLRDPEPAQLPSRVTGSTPYALTDFQSTVRVPEFLNMARGVQSVGFLERHRFASLIVAGLTTMAMIIGGLLIFL